MKVKTKIKYLKHLQPNEFRINTPDGWQRTKEYVEKGIHDEYVLTSNNKEVRCNAGHLFETMRGWVQAQDITNKDVVLHEDGNFHSCECRQTDKRIPIVDLVIDHKNHRYYTNGISSHNTNAGKTLVKCHLAASYMMQGYNVLYITMEMAEERISERIDANLMDIEINDLAGMPKDIYEKRVADLREKTPGRLFVKEFPTAGAHVGHFRHLLRELELKKKFKADVVFVDYLNICASSRIRGGGENTYVLIKSIAEELRGLAVEKNIAIISSTQTNRDGWGSSDLELSNTSECLAPDSTVIKIDGSHARIDSLKPNDKILSHDGFKTVQAVHHKKTKKLFKIRTKGGKEIVCSADHKFPTAAGRKCINSGLEVGSKIKSL